MKKLISYDAVQIILIVVGGVVILAMMCAALWYIYQLYWTMRCALGR